jgi:hypothetical protein
MMSEPIDEPFRVVAEVPEAETETVKSDDVAVPPSLLVTRVNTVTVDVETTYTGGGITLTPVKMLLPFAAA